MAFLVIAFMIEPVFISPLFNSYKPMTEGTLKQSILSMARANGVPVQDVSQFDASKQTNRISANVSGLFGTTAVRLNDNLLNRCTPAQVEGVMAHEIGHYVLNHLSKLLPFFGLLAVAAFAFLRWGLDRVVALRGEAWDLRGPSDLAGMPVLIALFMLFMTAATPVLNSVIRSQEIEADIFALNASQDPVAFADVELMLTEYRNPDPGPLEEFIFCDHPSPRNRIYNAMRWRAEHPGAERFSTSPGENPRGASH
jgi:STE24 endopeptidase